MEKPASDDNLNLEFDWLHLWNDQLNFIHDQLNLEHDKLNLKHDEPTLEYNQHNGTTVNARYKLHSALAELGGSNALHGTRLPKLSSRQHQ